MSFLPPPYAPWLRGPPLVISHYYIYYSVRDRHEADRPILCTTCRMISVTSTGIRGRFLRKAWMIRG